MCTSLVISTAAGLVGPLFVAHGLPGIARWRDTATAAMFLTLALGALCAVLLAPYVQPRPLCTARQPQDDPPTQQADAAAIDGRPATESQC